MTIHKTNTELEIILGQINRVVEEKVILPVGVSYKIVKNRLAIELALAPFRIVRDEIINRYSNGTGHLLKTDDNYDKATAEILQIAEKSADVDISEITLDELGEKELPLNVVSALGFMMK